MAVQLHSTGAGYQVSGHPIELTLAGRETREFTTLCDAASHAFRLHAAWVASFRDAGWTSVAYR
jgi:hypothetical protein